MTTPRESSEAELASDRAGNTTTYRLIGALGVDDRQGLSSTAVRVITFTVNHHEHWRDDTVDVVVENTRRPEDTFMFRVEPGRQGLSGVLGEIHNYVAEQERRAYADGDTIGQRAARMDRQGV